MSPPTTSSPFWERNASKKARRRLAALATSLGVPERALRILCNSVFDEDHPLGWVPAAERELSEADRAEAGEAGLMPEVLELDHDGLLAWVLAARNALSPEGVAGAFVASLTTRRLDLRSGLGSYAHLLHLEPHSFLGDDPSGRCAVCGIPRDPVRRDLTAACFRRLRWAGNVQQGDLGYAGLDLRLLAGKPLPLPTEEDWTMFAKVLGAIAELPPEAQLSDLSRSITRLFPSDKPERMVFLEILGYAGVLVPADWPSYFEAWVPPEARRVPSHFFKKEWSFPVSGWSGKDGIRAAAVQFWFPGQGA